MFPEQITLWTSPLPLSATFPCLYPCNINGSIIYNHKLFWPNRPTVGQSLLIHEVSRLHTMRDHIRQDFSGQVISPTQRNLPDNTQYTKQKYIHIPGGIRTHNFRRRAAADLRLKPRSYWDRPTINFTDSKVCICVHELAFECLCMCSICVRLTSFTLTYRKFAWPSV
jgi:hypothetical protein